jgi:hypothetical protein
MHKIHYSSLIRIVVIVASYLAFYSRSHSFSTDCSRAYNGSFLKVFFLATLHSVVELALVFLSELHWLQLSSLSGILQFSCRVSAAVQQQKTKKLLCRYGENGIFPFSPPTHQLITMQILGLKVLGILLHIWISFYFQLSLSVQARLGDLVFGFLLCCCLLIGLCDLSHLFFAFILKIHEILQVQMETGSRLCRERLCLLFAAFRVGGGGGSCAMMLNMCDLVIKCNEKHVQSWDHVQCKICVTLDLNAQCRTMCDPGSASVGHLFHDLMCFVLLSAAHCRNW